MATLDKDIRLRVKKSLEISYNEDLNTADGTALPVQYLLQRNLETVKWAGAPLPPQSGRNINIPLNAEESRLLTSIFCNSLTSHVRENVSSITSMTFWSSKNFSTASLHICAHSSPPASMGVQRTFRLKFIQECDLSGGLVRNTRPEKRLFTLFSSKLMVSIREVTPMTANALFPCPILQLWTVSRRQ